MQPFPHDEIILFHSSDLADKQLKPDKVTGSAPCVCGSSQSLSWLTLFPLRSPLTVNRHRPAPLRLRHRVCHAVLDAMASSVMETIANP
ncbi:uncharacterized protein V6R79_020445 [Siganus canaliculatus]